MKGSSYDFKAAIQSPGKADEWWKVRLLEADIGRRGQGEQSEGTTERKPGRK